MAGRDFVGGRPDAQGSRNTPVPLGLTSRFSAACFVVAVTLPAVPLPPAHPHKHLPSGVEGAQAGKDHRSEVLPVPSFSLNQCFLFILSFFSQICTQQGPQESRSSVGHKCLKDCRCGGGAEVCRTRSVVVAQ